MAVLEFTGRALSFVVSYDVGNDSASKVSWSPDGKYLAVGTTSDPSGFGGKERAIFEFAYASNDAKEKKTNLAVDLDAFASGNVVAINQIKNLNLNI